jgi:thiamine biosynthesis lipoprotein
MVEASASFFSIPFDRWNTNTGEDNGSMITKGAGLSMRGSSLVRCPFLTLCFLALFAAACNDAGREPVGIQHFTGATMGTRYSIKVVPPPGRAMPGGIRQAVEGELERINAWMSAYLADSEISRFNRSEELDWFEVSSETALVVEEALDVSRETEGAFDVTVAPLVNLWSFGPENRPPKAPEPEAIEQTRGKVGYEKLEVRIAPPALRKRDAGIQVDLAAIAKGFGVDRIARVLERHGIENYLVEIGGEIRARGAKQENRPWKVGVEIPERGVAGIQEVLVLRDRSLATSGDYRNFFVEEGKRYSHTIDPRTGRPVTHELASVTVVAESCMRADALATALMVLGPDEGAAFCEEKGLAALFLIRDGDRFIRRATAAFDERGRKEDG